MPNDLATAQRMAQQLGVQPPGGEQPGTPEYDQWVQAWFNEGLAAGDPRLVQAAGGVALGEGGTEKGWEDEGGFILDPTGKSAVPPSEWMGKRKPTPTELRRASFEGAYAGSEDGYNRFSDRQLGDWINKNWDAQRGGFFTTSGQMVGKPPDKAADGTWVSGYEGSGDPRGGGGGGGGGKPAQPPEAVTRGKSGELSYTGNPMTDMLIYQFNNRNMLNNVQGPNIFGALGGDTRPAGEVDKTTGERTMPDVTGQLLSGGGLWWTDTDAAKETFAGYGKPITAAPKAGGGAPKAAAPGSGADLYAKPGPGGGATPGLDQPMPGGNPANPTQRMLMRKRDQGYFTNAGEGGEFIRPY